MHTTWTRKGNSLEITLAGRIDSTNAAEVQKQIDAALSENPGCQLIIDANQLEYISSAGLRVLLTLTKLQNEKIQMQNVSPEVYEILEMTGFTTLLQVTKRMRKISVDGCEIIGRGAIGTVYRVDEDTIVKVYEIPDSLPMIENEQKRAKQAFLKGIPTAISYDVVKVGEKYGSVFELLRAKSYNDVLLENPDRLDEIIQEYARFLRGVHTIEMEPGELPNARDIFLQSLNDLQEAEILPEDLITRSRDLLKAMGDNLHVVHGDIHMKNIMLSGEEPLLIDMDTLAVGDPVFDLMSLYVTYILFNEDDPSNSETFYGLNKEVCDKIWTKLLLHYFDDRDASILPEASRRIQILACIRFLHLVGVQNIGDPALRPVRVAHTVEHLRELPPQVDSLEIGSLR